MWGLCGSVRQPRSLPASLRSLHKRAADAARAKADDDFKNEARALARERKPALRRKAPEHRDEDPREGGDRRSAEQPLASVEQAVGALPMADIAAVSAPAGISSPSRLWYCTSSPSTEEDSEASRFSG